MSSGGVDSNHRPPGYEPCSQGVRFWPAGRASDAQIRVQLVHVRIQVRVREFIDATVDHARTKGFVETMFGRRRMVPELNSILGWVEQLGEVNTDGVEPLTAVIPNTLRLREDAVTLDVELTDRPDDN